MVLTEYAGTAGAVFRDAVTRTHLLTERELDVFCSLGCGMANAEIARHLSITERTVKHHVTEIMTKLGVDSRLKVGIVACIAMLSAEPADERK
ncbi:LuxR C-terminal-related transcriptional regulator [Micromonospora sp. R77]|uniref:helix-turn-helix domain-containing protein n=1 Tax=Micromonospora sp. R77 TaxID=2925836 RepID=UPI001F61CA04|nr:LuxR C-terminal-related transcriptional regulator [Micromonospora sp. R77]MCI4066891.1 LuxR C-terminal-related transcriptional regulator [Micromonospora sp. R77]